MKKALIFLLIFILLFAAGCSKSEAKIGTPLSFEDPNILVSGAGGTANYICFSHLSEIQDTYTLNKTIVFRGVKEGLSTPIYPSDGGLDYCETNLRVTEAFYGDVKAGDLICHKELITVHTENGLTSAAHESATPPIEEDTEYLFILSKSSKKNASGGTLYGLISMHHSHHKLSDYEPYKQAVLNEVATQRQAFGYEVMDYYLNQPDTRLDLRHEVSAVTQTKYPADATQEYLLAQVPVADQPLFERMIDQYGIK